MSNASTVTGESGGGNGTVPVPTDVDRLAGWAVAGVGALLVVLTVLHGLVVDLAVFDAVVVTIPGFVVIGAWFAVRRSEVPARSYPRVLRATIAGVAVLGGFILAVVLVQGGPLVDSVPLVLFMCGIGGVGGVLVGNITAQNRLAKQQAEALRAEQERLVFLNHLLRHNVLNKVSIIKGNAATAAAELDPEAPYFETIESQSDDVAELVENVRVLVNATTSQRDLHPVDLTAAIEREIEAVRQSGDAVTVETQIDGDLTVVADDLIRYVVGNVLQNAVQHNDRDHPTVTVTADRHDDTVSVTVADDGPGIPVQHREALTEPEMTGDHGVGLYLVATLVRRYGGDLEIADNEPRGTEITITLRPAD